MKKGVSILGFTLLIMLVLGVIGGGFAFLYNTQEVISRSELRGAQSFFAAEAAIKKSLAKYREDNPSISLSSPVWYYGRDALSLSLPWTNSSYLPDHDLASEGAITFRAERFKLYDGVNEVYFYAEGVLREGGKDASRFPIALRMNKSFAQEGIELELGLGVGEVLIKRGGVIWKRLSNEGYRGGQALKRAFTLVGGGHDYEIVLGPGVYMIPMRRAGDYCFGLELEGNKTVVLRSARGLGPHWVKVVGILPYKSAGQPYMAKYWTTILLRNGANLTIEDLWISPPIERGHLEGEVQSDRDFSAILLDDVNTSLTLVNSILKNRDLVRYLGSSISGVRVLLKGRGVSDLSVRNCILDGGSFLNYETGSRSYGIWASKLSNKSFTLNAIVERSVIIRHDVGLSNEIPGSALVARESLFFGNATNSIGNVSQVNILQENPRFKTFYSFLKGEDDLIEWFRHWDAYVPDEGSILEEMGIGLTSLYWKRTVPVPKGGEIVLLLERGNSRYSISYFYDVDSAFNVLKDYYLLNPNGSSMLFFGRGLWYIKNQHDLTGIKKFHMVSAWGPLFTPIFVFLPSVWDSSSSTRAVLNFMNCDEVKINGFYFALSGGKATDGGKTFIHFYRSNSIEVTDCVFKRAYGGRGYLVEIKLEDCSDVNIYNNVFDHKYRKVVADSSGVPILYESEIVLTTGIQGIMGNFKVSGNLFWGESPQGGFNEEVRPQDEVNFIQDGDSRVINSPFNPLSYRLVLSNTNRFLEENFDGGDIGLRFDLYPYVRSFEGRTLSFVRLENPIEETEVSNLKLIVEKLEEGETLILGKGSYSMNDQTSVAQNGVALLGMWGPYYTKIKASSSLNFLGRGTLLYGLGFELYGNLSGGAFLSLEGENSVIKDISVTVKEISKFYKYGIKASFANGLLKNIYVNGGLLENGIWMAKCDYGIYIAGENVLIDHVNSLKHKITGVKWSQWIYGCNSYSYEGGEIPPGYRAYDPNNVDITNLSVHPEGGNDSRYNWLCFSYFSPCYWWNNPGEANTGSYRGVDWANFPIKPR